MRNVKIDSTTDNEFARRAAGTQPYNTVSLTVVTAGPSVAREDGSTEHGEDDVQNLEARAPVRKCDCRHISSHGSCVSLEPMQLVLPTLKRRGRTGCVEPRGAIPGGCPCGF
jgi:hypothetical protein